MRRNQSNQANADKEKEKDPYEGLSDDNHNEFAANLITQAGELQEEKKDVLSRIDNNRTLLRQVVASGFVSEKQAKFVELTYPPRKKSEEGESTAATPAAA